MSCKRLLIEGDVMDIQTQSVDQLCNEVSVRMSISIDAELRSLIAETVTTEGPPGAAAIVRDALEIVRRRYCRKPIAVLVDAIKHRRKPYHRQRRG